MQSDLGDQIVLATMGMKMILQASIHDGHERSLTCSIVTWLPFVPMQV